MCAQRRNGTDPTPKLATRDGRGSNAQGLRSVTADDRSSEPPSPRLIHSGSRLAEALHEVHDFRRLLKAQLPVSDAEGQIRAGDLVHEDEGNGATYEPVASSFLPKYPVNIHDMNFQFEAPEPPLATLIFGWVRKRLRH